MNPPPPKKTPYNGKKICEFSANSDTLDIFQYQTLTKDKTLIEIHPEIIPGEVKVTFNDKSISKDVNLDELRGETWFLKIIETATKEYDRISKEIVE